MTITNFNNLKTKVAELLVVRASGHLFDSQRNFPKWELSNSELKRLLAEGIGGVILFGGTSFELTNRCRMLNKWSPKTLLLCADVEEGVGQRFSGGSWLVPPMAIAKIYSEAPEEAIELAYLYGTCIGSQAKKCGLNWVLAPVCDVNTNPKNPVINVRAWGEDPLTVSELVCAFHRGLASEGVLSCAKHFPGHGDTGVDSHIDLPILDHEKARLEEIELVPFRSAISAGVSSVMIGHLLFSKFDASLPASLSKVLVKKLLRKELGFEGLVITDALMMSAISKAYGAGEAALLAFSAGADLILMPENPYEAIDAICEGLITGKVPMSRLDESLERRRNVLENISVSIDEIKITFPFKDQSLETNQDLSFANNLIRSTIKLRHKGQLIPNRPGINIVRVDGIFSASFLVNSSPSFTLPEEVGFKTIIFHQKGVTPWQNSITHPLAIDRLGKGPFLLQLFIRGNPFIDNQSLSEPWLLAIDQLQKENLLSGIIIYGSPYFWEEVIEILDASIPAVYSPGQMQEAQKQAVNALFQCFQSKPKTHNQIASQFTD